ncbi:hypothetical protein WJX72_001939 [[Myrmecia] bisecta]|uniref:Peptidase M3A/M3B catalytic domain-containing protein n=1 Tax=[Myrmecia] bisecta TaxID=41462 RepID=A0AAW1Q2M2_9CHLO
MAAADVRSTITQLNDRYFDVHLGFEQNVWKSKLGLKGNSPEELARSKTSYDAFLSDPANLAQVLQALSQAQDPNEVQVLKIMEKTFSCYICENEQAAGLKETLNQLEAGLAKSRGEMDLGYMEPGSGKHVAASSVQLRNMMKTSADEAVRRACYEGMRAVGPHVAAQLCEIVKLRNRLARMMGPFEDFYDYKVQTAEGFSKRELFNKLDALRASSQPISDAARGALEASKGAEATKPWNLSFALSGETEREMDPYFPFEDAVDAWARSFAALGINYQGATMRLDLCDRKGKYSNGFCHWPVPAYRKADNTWQASEANFTSLATPNAVGSGKTALVTLMHEGGHAAHFANIDQGSPFCSQERAPTSVAYAENQSMFLDAFVGDAAWLGRYARSREGAVIPWALIEKSIRATHPYAVFSLRTMLSVPYFEKALYELPDDQVTPETVLALADRIEQEVEGGPSPRPLMSVPHILADESSAYYHAYVLAEMSVHQTRDYFKNKYGKLVDNPQIGTELRQAYWLPGNTAPFLGLVEQLTGRPLSGDAWVAALQQPVEDKVTKERAAYEEAVAAGPAIPAGAECDLGMRIVLIHGDETIADSKDGYTAACQTFKNWVHKEYFK